MVDELKTWAIVEVMGRNEYAGFITAETIAGAPMLRIDVPMVEGRDGFTKFLAPGSLYGISPCTEETARLRAASLKKTPFEFWSVECQVIQKLEAEGKLSTRQLAHTRSYVGEDGDPDD